MTEQDYAQIAAACDRVLRAPGTQLARVAIPMLHVINEHPASIAQYEPLLRERWTPALSDCPRALLRAARGLTQACLSQPTSLASAAPEADVVIVSHLSSTKQLDQEHDLYFGPLQKLLQDRGISSLLLLLNHLPQHVAMDKRRSFESRRMLVPRTVTAQREAAIWQQCLQTHACLQAEAAKPSQNQLERRIATLASRQAFSAGTLINLRTHAALTDIFQRVNPRIVITTYEGDASERLTWHAARTALRKPLCVGYQHARLLKRAHAIRRNVRVAYIDCDPDVVLTLGERPHGTLAASPELSATRLIEYGSHRLHPHGAVLPDPKERPRQCLVLPDADEHECATLFDFAVKCAQQRPDVKFRLRPHPVVDTLALVKRHRNWQDLPPNVSFATAEHQPLADEFAQTRYCLYRGSSAALQAVLAGIKPFYLSRPGELSFDPLFELMDWRETVESPDNFITAVTTADATLQADAARVAKRVCERQVSPFRSAALDELLQMAAQ
jgi:hypothetical protein